MPMKITVNNEPVEIGQRTSIDELLEQLGLESGDGLALAVNQQVIPKKDWPAHQFQEHDTVLIIKASQGG